MKRTLGAAVAALSLAAAPAAARAQNAWDLGKKAVGGAAVGKVEGEVNRRLLEESRKNQCSFKTDSDQLAKGCDPKARRLANALKRVALLSPERSRAVKFSIDEGTVEVSSSSPEFGEAKEVIQVEEYKGKRLLVGTDQTRKRLDPLSPLDRWETAFSSA